ncbi:DUF4920 domain-containing protein [Taibaiella chishuiensis]|uniref:Uncharacterized protein DUF4920 n=1 Tax=Taibaiella chishuiensis TaxID=1434707 RepID=A0A2P8D669_9BACT|nr:DUF4920 domain-containing protein [Taibaiella chishuiensis]PSK92725.1 uncharacterized protein DUF4920 [Taibaiella chishuiensis]
MKKLLILSTLFLSLAGTTAMAQSNGNKKAYGAAFKQAEAIASPGRLDVMMKGKEKLENIQLSGYISEVCQKEGCWLRLRTNKSIEDDMFVKMKDHAFLLPKDIAGKSAIINGTVVKKVQSVAEQQHYLEDAGASKEEIAKITQPKETYQMQATGVVLLD